MHRINERDANRVMNQRRTRLANLPRRQPSPEQVATAQRHALAKRAQRQFKSAAAAALKADADRRFGYKPKKPHEQGVM